MIRLQRARVLEARVAHPGLIDLIVELNGTRAPAVAYESLCADIGAGDTVVVNTTAVDLDLGTGGVHFVVAVEGKDRIDPLAGHAMKLRYTPMQHAVEAVEERYGAERLDAASLAGRSVVVAGLHSAVGPCLIGAAAARPGVRSIYVMTEAAALHAGFSRSVAMLRARGLLDATITAGQAAGGDREAVTLAGALLAAFEVEHAGVVVVAMGPGNLGTASRWGSAALEVGGIVNTIAALGGTPVVVPRISFADARARHHGVSHHTITALGVLALAGAEIALPPLDAQRRALVGEQLAPLAQRHRIVEVDLGPAEQALRDAGDLLASMGRGFEDDPDYFRTAAAAGVRVAGATPPLTSRPLTSRRSDVPPARRAP